MPVSASVTSQAPAGSMFFQRLIASIPEARATTLARLRDLRRDHGNEVDLFCAHDPVDLERFGEDPTTTSGPRAIGSER